MSEAIASKEERLSAYYANIAAAEKDPSLSRASRSIRSLSPDSAPVSSFSAYYGCRVLALFPQCSYRCITRPSKASIRMR